MTTASEPVAPESLPKYLAEGLPKQDRKTLEDIQGYVEALLNYRDFANDQPIEDDDLPDDAELVAETPKGSIMSEYRTCGDDSCHCMNDGEKHGPYRYRVYRKGGTVKKEYLGKADD